MIKLLIEFEGSSVKDTLANVEGVMQWALQKEQENKLFTGWENSARKVDEEGNQLALAKLTIVKGVDS